MFNRNPRRIITNPEQERLFDAADAGLPVLMERAGKRYIVVNADRLDALAALMAQREMARIITPRLNLAKLIEG